uniref:hypothetical protein n=1 Tax=uncultured Sphingomonas sp. TaxID=158754 RepID=UPI0035CA7C2B
MSDPTLPSVVAQMSTLINSWQTYIDQQRALVNGVATYTTTTPAGQPGPGYYPVTDPAGLTAWLPCPQRTQADAAAFRVLQYNIVAQTAKASDSGAFIRLGNTGGTTTVKVTFPAGLGQGFNAIYFWEGTQSLTQFLAGTGVTLVQDQSLASMRSRYSLVTAISPQLNMIVLSGSMIT